MESILQHLPQVPTDLQHLGNGTMIGPADRLRRGVDLRHESLGTASLIQWQQYIHP